MVRKPDTPDMLIGNNIKLKRNLLGLTQRKLAKELGVTPQQIQKYEKGSNHVNADRLQQIADILGVPSSYFHDKLETAGKSSVEARMHSDPAFVDLISFIDTDEGNRLVSHFMRIEDEGLRQRIVELIVGISGTGQASQKG